MEKFTIITMSTGLILTFSVCLFTLWKFKRDLNERQHLERRLLEEAKLAEVSRRIADIGHDVKNMLTPIQMGMQLLEEELDEHFKTLPQAIQDHTSTTQTLYKDIISMARRGSSRIQIRVKEIADAVKGGSSPPQFAACHLGKIVDSVIEALQSMPRSETLPYKPVGWMGCLFSRPMSNASLMQCTIWLTMPSLKFPPGVPSR